MSTFEDQSHVILHAPLAVCFQGRAGYDGAYEQKYSDALTIDEWQSIARRLDLPPRQLQVTRSIFDGIEEREIAQRLEISPHTVHAHLNRMYRKLDVSNRCALLVQVFLAHLQEVALQPALETDDSGANVKTRHGTS